MATNNIENTSTYRLPAGVDPMEDDIVLDTDLAAEELMPLGSGDPTTTITEDGGAVIDFAPSVEDGTLPDVLSLPPSANLVAYLDDETLTELADDIILMQDDDKTSRKDWEDAYGKGIKLLGLKIEERTEPFKGASGVHHPLLAQACVEFQSQAYKELLPPGGPVRTKVVGQETKEALDQAFRIREFMNYQITEVMEEYDSDMDQLLFYLPLSGSCFKKVYYDPVLERTVSKFIPAENLSVPYSATTLASAPHIIHDFLLSGNEIRRYQANGFYSDEHEITDGAPESPTALQKTKDEATGMTPGDFALQDEYTILECHMDLDYEELVGDSPYALPFVVTIEKSTRKVLAIRKNWEAQDPMQKKLLHFVHYKFAPGLGFYGFGLVHMIGNLAHSVTGVLRQLIDAGTFANMQGGFKAKGMRVDDAEEPIAPGEWRDVDVPGGSIKEAMLPLQYKEPSQTLVTLLGALVESGQRFASTANMQLGDTGGQQMPVGTTIAMLEKGAQVMSAIHKRLHYAQKNEFRVMARVIRDSLAEDGYPIMFPNAEKGIMKQDFDDRVDIIPVSDPNIFSMAQRIMLASQQLQMAQAAPEIHNLREAYRRMYVAMNIKDVDSILKPDLEPQPITPMEEHAKVLQNQMLVAVKDMDHQAHIDAHILMLQHPYMQQNIEFAANVVQDIFNHVKFLAAGDSRKEIQIMQQVMPRITPAPQQDPQVELAGRQLDIQEKYNDDRIAMQRITAILKDKEIDSDERMAMIKLIVGETELDRQERQQVQRLFADMANKQRDNDLKERMHARELDNDRSIATEKGFDGNYQ